MLASRESFDIVRECRPKGRRYSSLRIWMIPKTNLLRVWRRPNFSRSLS